MPLAVQGDDSGLCPRAPDPICAVSRLAGYAALPLLFQAEDILLARCWIKRLADRTGPSLGKMADEEVSWQSGLEHRTGGTGPR